MAMQALQDQPPIKDKKYVTIFLATLLLTQYDLLIGTLVPPLQNLVQTEEKIEMASKLEKSSLSKLQVAPWDGPIKHSRSRRTKEMKKMSTLFQVELSPPVAISSYPSRPPLPAFLTAPFTPTYPACTQYPSSSVYLLSYPTSSACTLLMHPVQPSNPLVNYHQQLRPPTNLSRNSNKAPRNFASLSEPLSQLFLKLLNANLIAKGYT